MSARYLTGGTAYLAVGPIVDVHDGQAYDPSPLLFKAWAPGASAADDEPTFTYTYGDGPEVERDALGVFHVDLPLTDSGLWEYRFTWGTDDETGASGGAFEVDPDVRYPWAPTVDRIASMLRARTRGTASIDATVSGEQGTFNAITRPTAAQVIELIAQACDDLSGRMHGREPCTQNLRASATGAAAYLAAHLVETSYYPEQVRRDDTAATAFEKRYDALADRLAEAVVEQCPLPTDDGDTGTGSSSGMPIGRVPCRTLIGPSQVPW